MKQQMCARCGERPAVIYIQKMEGDEVKPEGLCIQCARELNIGSINQMIDKLGISDEELEQASEQMSQFMENMGDFNFGDMSGMFNSENMDGAHIAVPQQPRLFAGSANQIVGLGIVAHFPASFSRRFSPGGFWNIRIFLKKELLFSKSMLE